MKLLDFRITNYKTIEDSGVITCHDVTAFVGKNEAGKTSLLRALSKLKPTDKQEFDSLREFPRKRFTDEFKKQRWEVVTATFRLTAVETTTLASFSPLLKAVTEAKVTRYYDGQYSVSFEPAANAGVVTQASWVDALKQGLAALDAILPKLEATWTPEQQQQAKNNWGTAQNTIRNHLNAEIKSAGSPDISRVNKAKEVIIQQTGDEWSRKPLQATLDKIATATATLEIQQKLGSARQWIVDNMPSFLYFDDYDRLQTDIYLPEFLRRADQKPKPPGTRVQQAVFKHVNADIKQLAGLGVHNRGQSPERDAGIQKQIDELNIRANSAEITMTTKFSDWWLQRNHKFHYQFNGDYFRIWVSDDHNESKIEFEQRSQGFQYFFSFYLLFLTEAGEDHRNCILLLDEPGLHLHGTAQTKLIEFFDKLAKEGNQVLYTTHSPFLVDGDHLERARAVYETKSGTKVSDDVWPKDNDSLFPLQAALGYSICQSLFIAKRQVVVEGITDYMLLIALNSALPSEKRLRSDVVLLPIGGATNFAPFAALLASHGVKFAAIPDSDTEGNKAKAKLEKLRKIIGEDKARVASYETLTGDARVQELEDMIPEKYYLAAVEKAYPSAKLAFSTEEIAQTPSVVDRCKERVKVTGSNFDKLLPIENIVVEIHGRSTAVPPELYATAERIFANLGKLF